MPWIVVRGPPKARPWPGLEAASASVWWGEPGLSRSRPPGIPKLLPPLVFLFQPVLLLLLLALNIRRIELLLKCAIMGVVYLLQDVESRAGLLALAGGHRHAALGVVVDHPLVLDQSEVRWGHVTSLHQSQLTWYQKTYSGGRSAFSRMQTRWMTEPFSILY